jgi:hypothetical protein
MPYNGTGTFTNPYLWTVDAANGLNISATRMDTQDSGIAGGLSNCITRDGQGVPTAPIPWGGQDLTGVGTLSVTALTISGAFTAVLANASTVTDGYAVQRAIGLLDMPLTAGTAGRAIVLADRGYAVSATGNMTIPTNATTAFPIGSTVGVYNNSASNITIAAVTPGTTTLRLGGSATTGTRTLAQRGYVTLWKVATDEWVALNGGIS